MLMGGMVKAGTAQPTLEVLDALSRTRELSPLESLRLERAFRRTSGEKFYQHWNRADDYRLIRHIIRGRKPKLVAILMKRTERAIWRRLNRLGLSVSVIARMDATINGSKKRRAGR